MAIKAPFLDSFLLTNNHFEQIFNENVQTLGQNKKKANIN